MHANMLYPEGFKMNDIQIGKGSISIWAIIAAIGAIFAFISLFLGIFHEQMTVITTINGPSVSGLDLVSKKIDGHTVDSLTFWRFMPLFAALLGLATLVLAALPIFGVNNKGTKTAFLVCAVLTFIFGILVMFVTASGAVIDGNTDGIKFVKEVGAYFALIGGLLAALGAALDFFGVKI